jgi:hypothetical protein
VDSGSREGIAGPDSVLHFDLNAGMFSKPVPRS